MKNLKIGLELLLGIIALILHFDCANMAAVMSIDLGSEWMKVGVVSPGVPMEIALNKESKRKTPVFIGFRDNSRVFGEDAHNLGLRFPGNSYGYLTDLIGKTVDNPVVELYKSRFPWYNIEGDKDRNTVVFKNGNDTYSVEELIAQILEKAKEFAQDYTGQQITETVIIVPGYFGQAERVALLQIAKLANLKVLQLINDYTAVALNYGIFRRKEINETSQYFVFFDMGAYKTSAAVVCYQLVKDKVTRETVPSLQILGVGYDRNLGGLEMQIRLRDYLGKKFNEMKKTNTDIFTNARAMAKLFKEAGRVKNVLSANTETFAQIEGLLEDHDFRVQVKREEFENLCLDIFERIPSVLNKALDSSGLSLDIINQIVLFGGNTRVPKVQETLKSAVNKDLAKNINSDEAAAMGAVYRGADLATGFKVKKFLTKDAVLFPIQVVFDRRGESGTMRQVKRTLFGSMNVYPQKKVITFNKHNEDFTFDVNYEDLSRLGSEEIEKLGSNTISKIELIGVNAILENNLAENVVSKGIKAHFALDDSGIFELVNAEMIFEKSLTPEDNQNTFQKISNTISKLFSGDDDQANEEQSKNETEKESESSAENASKEENQSKANATVKNETMEANTNKTEVPKITTIKEPIKADVTILHVAPLDGDKFTESFQKVEHLNKIEFEKRRVENALNALESFVIDTQMKFEQEEYLTCATEEESTKILKACSEVSEWIYEDGENADAQTYEKKLEELTKLANEVYARHWEHKERPEALNALKSMINGSQGFLATARNLTKDNNPDKDVFTQVEIETLEKAIRETVEWRDNEVKEQEKLARHEPVRLTVKDITDKMAFLDREVKYLVNKIKLWKPKVMPKESAPKEEKQTRENETSQTEDQNEKNEESEDETKVESEPEQIKTTSAPTELNQDDTNTESKTSDDENHSEL